MFVWSGIVSLIMFKCVWYHKVPSFYTCCNTKNMLPVSDYRNMIVSEFRIATAFCSIFVLLPHAVEGRRIWTLAPIDWPNKKKNHSAIQNMNKNERTQCLDVCLWKTNAILLTQEGIWGHFLFCSMLMRVYMILMENMLVFFINYQHNED